MLLGLGIADAKGLIRLFARQLAPVNVVDQRQAGDGDGDGGIAMRQYSMADQLGVESGGRCKFAHVLFVQLHTGESVYLYLKRVNTPDRRAMLRRGSRAASAAAGLGSLRSARPLATLLLFPIKPMNDQDFLAYAEPRIDVYWTLREAELVYISQESHQRYLAVREVIDEAIGSRQAGQATMSDAELLQVRVYPRTKL